MQYMPFLSKLQIIVNNISFIDAISEHNICHRDDRLFRTLGLERD